MSAVTVPARTPGARAAWSVLALAWIALVVPAPLAVAAVGAGLAVVGAILAAMALRRGSRSGLAALVAALLVSPLAYVLVAPAVARLATGAEADTAPPRAAPAHVVRTPAAFRPTLTAVELASALQDEAASGVSAYAQQPLLVAGVVADVAPERGIAHLSAGDYPALELRGMAPAFAATLAAGRQVTVACDGARVSDGVPVAEGCGKAP